MLDCTSSLDEYVTGVIILVDGAKGPGKGSHNGHTIFRGLDSFLKAMEFSIYTEMSRTFLSIITF